MSISDEFNELTLGVSKLSKSMSIVRTIK